MLGSILDIGAKLAALANTAMSWFKTKSDQNDGRQLQRGDDQAIAIKDASDVQKQDAKDTAGGVDALTKRLLDEARP